MGNLHCVVEGMAAVAAVVMPAWLSGRTVAAARRIGRSWTQTVGTRGAAPIDQRLSSGDAITLQ